MPLDTAFFKPGRISPEVRHLVCSCADLDELRGAEESARTRCNAAEDAMLAAETAGDTAAYDLADIAFARADDELALIGRRADEMEEDADWAERKEQQREYWRAVL